MPPTHSFFPSLTAAPWRTAWSDPDLGHVADGDGDAPLGLEDDLRDVLDRADQPDAADDELLGVAVEDAAADVRVVVPDGLVDLADGQAVLEQPVRVDDDLVLLDVAAEGVDLADPRHGLEERA